MNVTQALARLSPLPHILLTGRACAALWLYVQARGWRDREVVVPANICAVVPYTILLSGNRVRFADVDRDGLMSAVAVRELRGDVAALLLTHQYGLTADLDLAALARQRGWAVIEDAAQALGGTYPDGTPLGTGADALLGSFAVGKQIDLGVGGFLAVRDAGVAQRVAALQRELPGYDRAAALAEQDRYRAVIAAEPRADRWAEPARAAVRASLCFHLKAGALAEEQLAEGVAALPRATSERRQRVAALAAAVAHPRLRLMPQPRGASPWRFNIFAGDCRDALLAYLRAAGIKATAYFPCAAPLTGDGGSYPEAEQQARTIINLWPGSETGAAEVARIGQTIKAFFGGQNG